MAVADTAAEAAVEAAAENIAETTAKAAATAAAAATAKRAIEDLKQMKQTLGNQRHELDTIGNDVKELLRRVPPVNGG